MPISSSLNEMQFVTREFCLPCDVRRQILQTVSCALAQSLQDPLSRTGYGEVIITNQNSVEWIENHEHTTEVYILILLRGLELNSATVHFNQIDYTVTIGIKIENVSTSLSNNISRNIQSEFLARIIIILTREAEYQNSVPTNLALRRMRNFKLNTSFPLDISSTMNRDLFFILVKETFSNIIKTIREPFLQLSISYPHPEYTKFYATISSNID